MISKYMDSCLRESLLHELESANDRKGMTRIKELSDTAVDHNWLWHLSKHHGPCLSKQEFVEAVRVRLGTAGPTEPTPCARCGKLFDCAGSHASCCGLAEATRGHYAVCQLVHNSCLLCDPSAEAEVPGLIRGTALRPADILTTALGNGMTALDVGITSPHAQQAGNDCAATMVRRKLEFYGPYLQQLDRDNIEYKPLVWSSYGRPHANTLTVLRFLSKRIARRRGAACETEIFNHLHASISTEIWRRAARQVMSCWPAAEDG